MTSHCQERLILLHFVPADSNLHFPLVKHLVPCVTTKDRFFVFSVALVLPHVMRNPSPFSAGFQDVILCVPLYVPTLLEEGTKRRYAPCGYT